jgi:hypothetical protein
MGNIIDSILQYLLKVVQTTASQLFILLGPGLILALIMYYVSNYQRNLAAKLFGFNFWIYFTAIGTAIHELGHAVFALLFGHQITDLRLFDPQEEGDGSVSLGYVRHSHQNTLYQTIGNFFIGIGPIILGSIVIYFSSKYLVSSNLFYSFKELSINTSTFTSLDSLWSFIQDVAINAKQMLGMLLQAENFTRWQFYLFIYIALAVGSHVKLSLSDLEGAWEGFIPLVGLIFMINLVTLWIKDFATKYIILISHFYSFFYAIMVFSIIMCLVFLIIFVLILAIKKLIGR